MRGTFKVVLLFIHLCVPHLCEESSRQQGASEPQSSPKHERRESDSSSPSIPIESHSAEKQQDRLPYMCSILHRGSRSHVCSGFFIRPDWVVTAAGCLDRRIDDIGLNPIVYCPANDKDVAEKRFFSGKGVTHPLWSGDYREGFDIALVELDRETHLTIPEFNKHRVRRAFERQLTALGKANATSTDRLDSPIDSMRLSYITLGVFRGHVPFTVMNHMIFVGTEKNDTLKGDVGGPLLIPDRGDRIVEGLARLDYVLGIASKHISASPTSASIYTSIAHFWNWIEHVVDGKSISSKELHKPTPFLATRPWGHRYADISKSETVITNIKSDNSSVIREYLGEGLNPHCVSGSDRYTLLHWAARYNSSDCIEVLIEFGANVDAKDKHMRTPLITAARYGGLLAAKVLLTHWADIEATNKYQDTPLIYACADHKWDVAELLINKGANVQAKNYVGWTALHWASQYGGADVVKLLLSKGAEVDARNNDGETPLWRASYSLPSSNVQTVKALLDAGASKTLKANDGTRPYDVICKCCTSPCSESYKKQLRELLNPTSSLIDEQTSVVAALLR